MCEALEAHEGIVGRRERSVTNLCFAAVICGLEKCCDRLQGPKTKPQLSSTGSGLAISAEGSKRMTHISEGIQWTAFLVPSSSYAV